MLIISIVDVVVDVILVGPVSVLFCFLNKKE